MPSPRVEERYRYYSSGDVMAELELSEWELRRLILREVLPAPTYINQHGLRFFDKNWLTKARAIINPYRARKAKRTAAETPGN